MIRFGPYLNGFQDVARQWPDDVRRRVDAATAHAAALRRAVRTPHDALAYQRRVRDLFWSGQGGLPETSRAGGFCEAGDVEHLGVRITKVIYESHPDVSVSALLYRPSGGTAGRTGRRPAVLFLAGHHATGKHAPEYQRVCLDLALHGLIVLAIDPWGQGERWQYVTPGSDEPVVSPSVHDHAYCGVQCFLTGGSLGRYFAWDAVRGVDVLCGLAEVDPRRIGATGNSGGGTQTTLLMMADERLGAAMPNTYVHGMSILCRAGLPHDPEQNFDGSLANGIDHADLLASFAPKPLLVGAVSYDFFPLEATEQSVAEAHLIYEALGARDKLRLVVDDDRHWYTDVLREHAVRFFTRELGGEERYERREIPTLPEERLWCSPSGQLYRDRPGSRAVFDLNRAFLAERRRPAAATAVEATERLGRVLDWPAPPGTLPIRPRYFAASEMKGRDGAGAYSAQRFYFFTQPDIAVAGTMLRPPVERSDALTWLVLLPAGTASDQADLDESLDLVRDGHRVCLFDPRGRGAVRSVPTHVPAHGASEASRGYEGWLGFEAYTNCLEMLLGSSVTSARVFDVARALEFLAWHEAAPGGLALRGHGAAALWGYLAAALDTRVRVTVLTQMLPSWNEIVETRVYDEEAITAAVVIHGVLQQLDLPDLRQCFDGRELRIESPLRVAAAPEQLPFNSR